MVHAVKVLTVWDDEFTYEIQVPQAAELVVSPSGEKSLRVPAVDDLDRDFADADGRITLAPFMLIESARHGWGGLALLRVTPRGEEGEPEASQQERGQDAPIPTRERT